MQRRHGRRKLRDAVPYRLNALMIRTSTNRPNTIQPHPTPCFGGGGSVGGVQVGCAVGGGRGIGCGAGPVPCPIPSNMSRDRKSTRLNSSHQIISYAVFCLKKKKTKNTSAAQTYFHTPSVA